MKTQSGFTLSELLTVIAIVAVLMAIGSPSYRSVTNSNRLSTEVNALLGDMEYARVEAIKEGLPVTVCTSTDGANCVTGAANLKWQGGWIVFSDANNSGTVDPGEVVLRVQKSFSGTDTFTSDNSNRVTFNREGFAWNLGNANVTVTLHDSTSNQAYTRCLFITTVGLMTTQTHATNPSNCT